MGVFQAADAVLESDQTTTGDTAKRSGSLLIDRGHRERWQTRRKCRSRIKDLGRGQRPQAGDRIGGGSAPVFNDERNRDRWNRLAGHLFDQFGDLGVGRGRGRNRPFKAFAGGDAERVDMSIVGVKRIDQRDPLTLDPSGNVIGAADFELITSGQRVGELCRISIVCPRTRC